MPCPNYLFRRGESYYLRLPIPKSRQSAIGKREIWKSLGRCSYAKACEIVKLVAGDYLRDVMGERLLHDFEELLSSDNLEKWLQKHGLQRQLTEETFESLKHDIYALCMTSWLAIDEDGAAAKAVLLQSYLKQAMEGYQKGNYALGKSLAHAFLQSARISAEASPELLSRLHKEAHAVYLMAIYEAIEKLRKGETIERGTFYSTGRTAFLDTSKLTINAPTAKPKKEPAKQSAGITLTGLIEHFNSVPETKKKTKALLEKYDSYQDYMIDLLGGDTPIESITKPYVRENLYSVIECLPANATKLKEFKGLSRKEIAKKCRLRNDLRMLAASSRNDILEHLSTLFKFAEGEGHDVSDPTQGLRFKEEVAPEDKRNPFTVEQLNKIFASEEVSGAKDDLQKAYLFWIPAIGLLTGMRVGEIIQLRCKDIRKQGEHHFISINRDGGKTTKTSHSVRIFPVYSCLLRLGFLDYCERAMKLWGEDAPLFQPIVKGVSNPADAFSKKFRRVIHMLGIKNDKLTLHSLRHNFRDFIRNASISDNEHSEILRAAGWKEFRGAVHGGYGSQAALETLIRICDKFEFNGIGLIRSCS